MAHHAYVCCSELPPCPECVESCDFATSYSFTGLSFSFSFDASYGNCLPCPYEGGGGGGSFGQRSYSIRVDAVQLAPITFTRVGSGGDCRYEACGELDVTYEVTEDVRYGCCAPEDVGTGPTADCSDGQTIQGARTVSFSLLATCECFNESCCGTLTDCRWRFTLTICGFPIATSHEVYVADCETNPDCGVEPGGHLFMNGAVITWVTPLVALDTLTEADHCLRYGPYANLDEQGAFCDPEVTAYGLCGPFAIDRTDTAVAECGATTGSLWALTKPGLCYPCDPATVPDTFLCGGWSGTCECIRYDAGFTMTYPTYV